MSNHKWIYGYGIRDKWSYYFVNDCVMFIPSKDKIDKLYASFQVYFNIEDYGELNKYLGIDLSI